MANLTPRRSRKELSHFKSEDARLFNDYISRSPFERFFSEGDWVPAIDISETSKDVVIHAEVPGIDAKDIDISLNGRMLTIKGEKKQEHAEKEESYHCIERRYGS